MAPAVGMTATAALGTLFVVRGVRAVNMQGSTSHPARHVGGAGGDLTLGLGEADQCT